MGESFLKVEARRVDLWYGTTQALFGIDMDIVAHGVTALIGPSGCGKSTFLRCLNRMNELIPGVRMLGEVRVDGRNIYGPGVDEIHVRSRMGMVFQEPNPFPKSIYDNIAYAPRIHGLVKTRTETDELVETSLRKTGLWGEVSDRLQAQATRLSGGQQQRLCIARAIAMHPDVLLMDEPCSALDPIATAKIEELIEELRSHYTILIVTHNLQQAARTSDFTAFFHLGKLIEYNRTKVIFHCPGQKMTEDYISGRFG